MFRLPGDTCETYNGLRAKFVQSNVLMNIDVLRPGDRFAEKLAEALSKHWVDLFEAKRAS
jgi:hypothetical protein